MPRKYPLLDAAARIEERAADGFSIIGIAKSMGTTREMLQRWMDEQSALREAFERSRSGALCAAQQAGGGRGERQHRRRAFHSESPAWLSRRRGRRARDERAALFHLAGADGARRVREARECHRNCR